MSKSTRVARSKQSSLLRLESGKNSDTDQGDDDNMFRHDDCVWAKFRDYPWWPAQIWLDKRDRGRHDNHRTATVQVRWFGAFGVESNGCGLDKIIAWDPDRAFSLLHNNALVESCRDAMNEANSVYLNMCEKRGVEPLASSLKHKSRNMHVKKFTDPVNVEKAQFSNGRWMYLRTSSHQCGYGRDDQVFRAMVPLHRHRQYLRHNVFAFIKPERCIHHIKFVIRMLSISTFDPVEQGKKLWGCSTSMLCLCVQCAMKLVVNLDELIEITFNGFTLHSGHSKPIKLLLESEKLHYIDCKYPSLTFRFIFSIKRYWKKVLDQIHACLADARILDKDPHLFQHHLEFLLASVGHLKAEHVEYMLDTWKHRHCFVLLDKLYQQFRKNPTLGKKLMGKVSQDLSEPMSFLSDVSWVFTALPSFIIDIDGKQQKDRSEEYMAKFFKAQSKVCEADQQDPFGVDLTYHLFLLCSKVRSYAMRLQRKLPRRPLGLKSMSSSDRKQFIERMKWVKSYGRPALECGYCKAMRWSLKLCKNCKLVQYCNKQCQKRDWTLNRHKLLCRSTNGTGCSVIAFRL